MTAVRRRLALAVLLAAVVGVSCTPAEMNRWLAERGMAPLEEPELSRAAAGATTFWAEVARQASFVGRVDGVSLERLGLSWRPGCPIDPADLRMLTLSYWGFDGQGHTGELVVHRRVASGVVGAFKELWDAKFPIRQMVTAEKFVDPSDFRPDGSFIETNEPDLDDNTSGFFCRRTTLSTTWSQHTYGLAVDVNPVENPYWRGRDVVPPNGLLPRDPSVTGTIVAGSLPVAAFRRAGMTWGGDWTSMKDWMHFTASGG